MQKTNVYRFNNRYIWISMASLFALLFISWFFTSSLFYWLFLADFETEPDLIGQDKSEVLAIMIHQIMAWELYISQAMTYTMYFIPLFSLLPVLQFVNEKKYYLQHALIRKTSFKKHLFSTVLKYAFISGLCLAIPFVLFFTIGNLFLVDNLDNIGNFASFLGESFYSSHPYLFFVFMSCSIYFSIGFVFGLMGCAISLLTDKSYLVLIIPMLYYLVVGNIGQAFQIPLINIMHSVIAYNTLYTTLELFIPLLFPLLASLLAFILIGKRGVTFGN
ncbi:hypothetical protein HXA31_13265 [Salipaludibacillus agaradhaerens]|uniref:Uncharacterized protein n=1 Tax=Salipaludibacillus agaradhaerens TaxID=76935 RepID=A0A9Q4AZ73_SALAG|nr:hypothetical protein [Salipaludibacillus agaradhaerens]MCR6095110.1 hypothetical protein [Salipaludibacillus agaradhaerens]MCR6115332.1 hypothetical protein [Salipaludibacillus agaradhaerens]